MSTWTRRIIIGVVVVAILAAGLQFVRSRPAAQTQAQGQFTTAEVDRGSFQKILVETGSVAAAREAIVRPETTGEVTDVLVKQGQKVNEGDMLFRLSNESLSLQVQQSRLDYQLALQRLANVLGVSPDRALQTTLPDRFQLTTDTAGRVTEVMVRAGQNITSGTPLVRTVDDERILFVARVNQPQMQRIEVGQSAAIFTDGFAKRGTPGEVVAVDQHGQPEDGSIWYDVSIAVDNPGALKAGMTGQADIETPSGTVRRDGEYQWLEPKTITAERAGLVEEVLVKANEWIEEGDAIVTLSSEAIDSQASSERLQVEKARLALRMRELEAEKLVATAPISGIITALDIHAGDEVSVSGGSSAADVASGSIIIADEATMEITVEIDELDIVSLEEGQPVTIRVNALPGQEFDGQVSSIALRGTTRTGVATFDVTITISNPDNIRPGMTAEVSIPVAERNDVVRVPSEAVTVGESGTDGTVTVIGEDGKPQQRNVELGLRTDEWTEIVSGLEPGESVVTARVNPSQGFFQRANGGTQPPH